jgi:surface protein
MFYLFSYTDSFNQDIGDWDVSSVSNMEGMFYAASSFNQDIAAWDVSSVTIMDFTFQNASTFNQNLSGWCVENITEEPSQFAIESALQLDFYPVWGTCPNQTTNEVNEEIPSEFALHQNYPNPFNPSTNIQFDLPKATQVKLTVFNMLGQEVAVLVNEFRNAGSYTSNFDASGLSSGVYVYQITTSSQIISRKMMLVK